MIIEEFVALLGVKADTDKVKGFADALTKVGAVATVVAGAVKAVALTAWAFADGYVRRAEELHKSNDSLVKITKEQVEMSKKYQDGMDTLGKMIESVKIKVAFGFLPTMLNMVNTFNDFLVANKDLIANGITKLLTAVGYLSQVINNTVRFIVKIIETTVGWKGALLILVGVLTLVKKAMLLAFITNPITWIILAIGALLLLIDDFMTYLDGGESQFGEFWGAMIKWIDEVKPSLQAVWDMLVMGMSYLIQFGVFVTTYLGGAFKDAFDVIVAVFTLLVGLFTGNTALMSEAWNGLIENLVSMFQNFAMLFEPLAQSLVSIMSKVWDFIVSAVKARIDLIVNAVSGLISAIGGALSSIFDVVTAPFAQAFDWITNKFSSIGGLISGAVSGAKGLVGLGGASTASNKTVNGGNLTINAPVSVTGNNAQAIGGSVANALYGGAGTAYRNMNTGVKA